MKATGLRMVLKPIFVFKNAKHGPNNIEGLLPVVGKNLPREAFRRRRFERPNKKTREIHEFL